MLSCKFSHKSEVANRMQARQSGGAERKEVVGLEGQRSKGYM